MDARPHDASRISSTNPITVPSVSTSRGGSVAGHQAGGVHPITHTEPLTWLAPQGTHHMPDADTTVMLSLEGLSEPTFPGYWDGQDWIDCTGSVVTPHVVSWAHMPAGFFPGRKAQQ